MGIVAILAQMALTADTRSQFRLSMLSWAAVIVHDVITKARGGSVGPEELERRRASADH